MRVPTINEPYHLMASWPTLWLTEKAPAKCHRQAECTCEIIREKRVIHRLIGQSKLLLIANSQVSWTHSHRFQIPHWFLSKTIITTTISTDLKNPKKPQEMILHMFRLVALKLPSTQLWTQYVFHIASKKQIKSLSHSFFSISGVFQNLNHRLWGWQIDNSQ